MTLTPSAASPGPTTKPPSSLGKPAACSSGLMSASATTRPHLKPEGAAGLPGAGRCAVGRASRLSRLYVFGMPGFEPHQPFPGHTEASAMAASRGGGRHLARVAQDRVPLGQGRQTTVPEDPWWPPPLPGRGNPPTGRYAAGATDGLSGRAPAPGVEQVAFSAWVLIPEDVVCRLVARFGCGHRCGPDAQPTRRSTLSKLQPPCSAITSAAEPHHHWHVRVGP